MRKLFSSSSKNKKPKRAAQAQKVKIKKVVHVEVREPLLNWTKRFLVFFFLF